MIVCSVVDQNPNEIHIQDTGFTKEVFYLNFTVQWVFFGESRLVRKVKSSFLKICYTRDDSQKVEVIEEGWRKKPRQTDVVVFWGKIATHMLLFRLCSRRVDKRRAGSKM